MPISKPTLARAAPKTMKTFKRSRTAIRVRLNGKQVLLSENPSTGEYNLTIDGTHQGTFILFSSAIGAIEKKTSVNYPF